MLAVMVGVILLLSYEVGFTPPPFGLVALIVVFPPLALWLPRLM